MAYTAPRTWVVNEIVSAAIMNTHVRDNFLETAVAKVTTAGDIVYATGANALSRLGPGGAYRHARLTSGNNAVEYDEVGVKYVVKSADESVTSSATSQNDDHLAIAIGANEVWYVELCLGVISGASGLTPGLRVRLSGPSGSSGGYVVAFTSGASYAALGSDVTGLQVFTFEHPPGVIQGIVRNSSNSGNIQFAWGQNASSATATTIKSGSFMRGTRMA